VFLEIMFLINLETIYCHPKRVILLSVDPITHRWWFLE